MIIFMINKNCDDLEDKGEDLENTINREVITDTLPFFLLY